MKLNDVIHHNNKKGVVKGFSKDGWVVYVQFPDSKAMIPILRYELQEDD